MTPFNPLKILRFVDDVKAMQGDESGPYPELVKPRMLLLYPSMTCSQGCKYCYYMNMHEAKAFLYTEKIKEVFDDSRSLGVEGVELCGGGEPLLHPEILDWLEYGDKKNLRFGVLTHGALPNRAELFKWIGIYFSYFRISLDYADPEKYAESRGTSTKAHEWAITNIATVMAARDKAQEHGLNSDCMISIKATVWKQTPEDIVELCYLGKRMGVDSIQFKRADEVELSIDDDRSRRNGIIEVLEQMKRGDEEMPPIIYNFGQEKLTCRCWITPIHIFVETDGSVILCCYYTNRKEEHTIGNIHDHRLINIWGSERHKEVLMNTDPDHCNLYTCRFVNRMKILDDAIEKMQLEFV